jgi:3-hydroxy-9,10-secoandrosta-1,3,5(10)-triene-9,17-dione monooxygenase
MIDHHFQQFDLGSPTMTMLDESAAATDVVARTWEIVPELRARAERAGLDRKLPRENIEALRRAGSMKTIQARRNGGYGLGIRSHVDVIRTLGRGCGSTAWVVGVVHAHSWVISHMQAAGQDEIYANPDNMVSAVIGPRGQAQKVDGGFRLTGVWPFGSGCENADWLLLGARVLDGDGNVIDEGDFGVRQPDVTIRDDWHVSGLRGTGSCTMEVNDLFIPDHLFVSLPSIIMRQSPGAGLHEEWVQDCAAVPVLAIALCAGALGIAEQALEDYPALIMGKTIAYTAGAQETNAITHLRVAEAAMAVHEGKVLLYTCADQIDEAAKAGTEVALIERARMRVDVALAVRRCLEAVEILFKESGASGVRSSSPLCRAYDDLRAINNHGLLKLETNMEMYGRLLLGQTPNTPLI